MSQPFAVRTNKHVGINSLCLFFLLAALCVAAEQDTNPPKTVRVFLLAGQSNMAGADSEVGEDGFAVTDADRRTLFTTAPLPQGDQWPHYVPWQAMRGHQVKDRLVHGPEVGFARTLDAAGWKDIAIIKVFANYGRQATEWPWGEGGYLFDSWTRFVDARLAELKARGFLPQVEGFVWHQGIDDAIHGKLAAQYEQNLTQLIATLRQRYGNDRTPFVLARSVNSRIAQPTPDPDNRSPMAQVRAAQLQVAKNVPHTAWIDVDDLPNVNTHHFSADSQLVIGRRFAEAWKRLHSPDGRLSPQK